MSSIKQKGKQGKRSLLKYLLIAILSLSAFFYIYIFLYPHNPPTRDQANKIVFGHQLIAYEIWEGIPYVAFIDERGGKDLIFFDRLKLNPISIEIPPISRWQLTGDWWYVDTTDQSGSFVLVGCHNSTYNNCDRDIWAFGQINKPDIAFVEIEYAGKWIRHAVRKPGFILNLNNRVGEGPSAYRWLDAKESVIYSPQEGIFPSFP